jgi:hypothetical protein
MRDVCCFLLLFSAPLFPLRPLAGPVEPNRALDPLLYAHVVVECTIESIRHSTATDEQLSIPSRTPEEKTGILIAELSDVVVLRGAQSPSEVTIGLELDPRALVGQRVILCGYWLPKLHMFAVWFARQGFVRRGDRWESLARTPSDPPEEQLSLTSQEVQAVLRQVEAPELARKANSIVVGRIRAATDTTVVSPGQKYRMRKVVLDVDDVLKGDPSIHTVWFLAAKGYVYPTWGAVSPREFKVGERWIALLGYEQGTFFPLSGVNGLLWLDGDKVIFDRAVEYRYSRDRLLQTISEAVGE